MQSDTAHWAIDAPLMEDIELVNKAQYFWCFLCCEQVCHLETEQSFSFWSVVENWIPYSRDQLSAQWYKPRFSLNPPAQLHQAPPGCSRARAGGHGDSPHGAGRFATEVQPAHGREQRAEEQGEEMVQKKGVSDCAAAPTLTSHLGFNILPQLMQYESSPDNGAAEWRVGGQFCYYVRG